MKRTGRPGRRVVALAGRRIDAAGAPAERFPIDHVNLVARRLRATFRRLGADTLVCAAANGADLVALRVAQDLGMRRRIVLPLPVGRFRRISVIDRPGGELWGWLFDDLVAKARAQRDLVVLGRRRGGDPVAFAAGNRRIIREAQLVAGRPPVAVIVWEGASRGEDDATAEFARLAREQGWRVRVVRSSAS